MPEYWIVDVAGRSVEVYTEPSPAAYGRVRRVAAGERLSPAAFPEIAIAVSDLFS